MRKRLLSFFLTFVFLLSCCLISSSYAATKGEQNALQSAIDYLNFTHFSYNGLYKQLEYEGYSHSECIYAVDNCNADWYDQAAGSANDYLSFTSFSKKGLIEQLEYEGFSREEAEYGAAVAYGENPVKPSNQKKNNQTNTIPNNPVNTEDDFLSLAEKYVSQVIDLSDKKTIELSASETNSSYCVLLFNFTEGDQSILAIDGGKCKTFYSVEDEELLSSVFQLITKFDQIESSLPSGKKLQYKLRFSDEEIQYITSETISKYYSWIR